jgi:hypothetical protein
MTRALDILLGRRAAALLGEQGWRSDHFDRLLGASGGPKWLILGELDRVLFGEFLPQRRGRPLAAIGSSIGAWRHASLAQADPAAAIQRFEDIYLSWHYSERPDAREVSAASLRMLEVLLDGGAANVAEHPWLHSYIVTARGRGPASAESRALLAPTLAAAAAANALSRQLLPGLFQRVVFSSRGAPPLPLADFDTLHCTLSEDTVAPALHATGSIPFILRGERNIAGAPPGHYWDGGIIDYHFAPASLSADGLILYPHFRGDLTVGWFDKFLPWRREQLPVIDNLVLLCPSPAFIASLPLGKIPDRSDFKHLGEAERQAYWRQCIARSRELADEFRALLESPDPLAGARIIGAP